MRMANGLAVVCGGFLVPMIIFCEFLKFFYSFSILKDITRNKILVVTVKRKHIDQSQSNVLRRKTAILIMIGRLPYSYD